MQPHDDTRMAKDRPRLSVALRTALFEIFAVRARGVTGVAMDRKGSVPARR